MPINFPNSPSPNELYTYDGKTWEWNGIYWEVYSALTGYITSAYTVGDGYSSISGVSGGNIALKSFSGNNITILDSGSKLTFSVDLLNNYLPLSGGTVSGATIFTSNLSANTLSATTYQNLPYGVAGVNNQTVTAYTFSLTDSGYLVTFNSSTYIQATIPTNTSAPYAIGSQIMLSQLGAGQLRVTGDTGVTLYSYGNAYNLVGQYSTAFLTKQATNTWILDGNLTTLNL